MLVFGLFGLAAAYAYHYVTQNPDNGFIRNLPDKASFQARLESNLERQNSLVFEALERQLDQAKSTTNTPVYEDLNSAYSDFNQALAGIYNQDRRDEFEKSGVIKLRFCRPRPAHERKRRSSAKT